MNKKEEKEFSQFYKLYHRRLFTYINKQVKDISISEEIVQDVMLEYAEHIRSGKQMDSTNAYIYGISRHKIADFFRKKRIKQILVSALPEQFIHACATLLFQDSMTQNEMKDKIVRILDMLPNDYALIIRLKYIEGMPVRLIARSLSMSFKSAESMLFRARKLFAHLYKSA